MKFKLDQVVIFEGAEVIVWDYSLRYNEYDVKLKNDFVVHGIAESDLTELS